MSASPPKLPAGFSERELELLVKRVRQLREEDFGASELPVPQPAAHPPKLPTAATPRDFTPARAALLSQVESRAPRVWDHSVANSLPRQLVKAYEDAGLSLNRATCPKFRDENVREFDPEPLYAGDVRSVRTFYKKRASGRYVLKTWNGEDAAGGIRKNLAAYECARLLGLNVCPASSVGVLTPPGSDRLLLGLVMDMAPGMRADGVSSSTFQRPEVQRELTRLQVLDFLTGQANADPGNVFIQVNTLGAVVTGTDHDASFPSEAGSAGQPLPPVLDEKTAQAIRQANPEEARRKLALLLAPAELEATLQRLQALKDHVAALEKRAGIVSSSQWKVTRESHGLDRGNCYWVRHHELSLERERPQGDPRVRTQRPQGLRAALRSRRAG